MKTFVTIRWALSDKSDVTVTRKLKAPAIVRPIDRPINAKGSFINILEPR